MKSMPGGTGGARTGTDLLMLGLLLLMGCSGSDGPTDPTPDPAFSLSISPSSLSVDQGEQGQLTLSVSRSGGFAGAVSVAVEGLPAGVTTGGNLSIPGGSSSLTVTLAADGDAESGSASVTFRGTSGDLPPQTASLSLTVNEVAAPPPDFELSLDPSSISLEGGSSGETTVSVNRTGGFQGSVTLSATGLPSGVSAAFDPAEVTGASSALTFSAEGSAATGTVSVSISGTSSEVGTREATLSLEITAPDPPPGGGSITWLFCGEGASPPFVALQDGDGAWTRLQGTGSTFAFELTASRGGVAWVEDRSFGTHMEVFFGSAEELRFFGLQRCDDEPGEGFSVSGSVEGLGVTQQAFVTLGTAATQVLPQLGSSFTLNNVREGTQDLVATLSTLSSSGGDPTIELERLLLRRNLNPTPGMTLAPLDFDGAEAFEPVDVSVTIQNLDGQRAVSNSFFLTGNGTTGLLFGGGLGSTSPDQTVPGIPASRAVAGDLQMVTTLAFPGDPSQVDLARGVFAFGPPAAALTVALGPELTTLQVQALPTAGDGSGRVGVAYPIQSAYDRHWTASFTQDATTAQPRSVAIQLSADYRGSSSGEAELEIPDLSDVPGWDSSWGLEVGGNTEWVFSATGGDPVMDPRTAGTRIRFGNRQGEIVP